MLRSVCATAVLGIGTVASAQTTQPTGLNAPSDDALLNELARRDLGGLLERAFETHHTPPAQRDAVRATAALAKLARDGGTMTPTQRRAIVAQVVAGIRPVIGSMNDPRQLTRQADALMTAGAAAEVNTLEYWGPSTVAQAQLRPVAEVVIALLDRAIQLADQQADALATNANANDAAALRRIEAAELVGQIAQQSRALAQYQLALACDPSDPKRAEAIDAVIRFLEPLNADENPAHDAVRIELGKLLALKGDFAGARTVLDSAITSTAAAATMPAESQQAGASADTVAAQRRARAFEARYFRAVVEVQARDARAARQQFDKLRAWEQQTNAASDPSIAIADRLLEYRILALEPGDAAKQRAATLLMQLLSERPDLEGPIMTQLRATIPPDAPVATLEPLLLRSLVTDAQERVVRAQADPRAHPDPAVLTRGLDAANELARRHDRNAGVDDRTAAEAAFLVPVFLEALDRKPEAAAGYLDFAEAHKQMPELAKPALANAQRVFAQLGGVRSNDPNVTKLYDRILPLSIGEPFNQRELLYEWALRQQQTDHLAEAIETYAKVPPADPNYAAARYMMLIALTQQLDALPANNAGRGTLAQRIVQLSDEVLAATQRSLAAESDERSKIALRQRLARTTLIAADAARTGHDDPARALALLNNLESTVRGLPDEEALLGEAIFMRVQANAALGHTDQAVADLERLLSQSEGMRGAQVVYNLLTKLEADFAAADAAGDRQRMAQIQANRASLTRRLVDWAQRNLHDPALLYRYRVYDAETQRIAATLLDDPAARDAKRAEARRLFEALDSAEGRALYRQTRAASQPAPRFDYDPRVALGLARLKFDAGDWAGAEAAFAQLLSDRAVGGAIAIVPNPATGGERQVDNDVYWECTLRLFQSRLKDKGDPEPIRAWLREQYARKGDTVGGARWRDEFADLRRQLLPDATTAP